MQSDNLKTIQGMIEYWQNNELVLTTIHRSDFNAMSARLSFRSFNRAKAELSATIDSMKNFLLEFAAELEAEQKKKDER